MISPKILQILLVAGSMTSQMLGMLSQEIRKSSADTLELKLNPQYEVYKKIFVVPKTGTIAVNSDTTKILTGSSDRIARIWDVESGKLLKELKGHTEPISSVALSANGAFALTSSYDGTVRVWDTNTGELLKTLQEASPVYSAKLSADGTRALTLSDPEGGIVRFYNTNTGELLKELPLGSSARSIALSGDGTLALISLSHAKLQIWNMNTGELLKTLGTSSFWPGYWSVELSADGAIALAANDNNKVLIWDTHTGALLNKLKPDGNIISLALSRDGQTTLMSTQNGNIEVWNTKPLPEQQKINMPLTELKIYATRNEVSNGIAIFSGDNSIIASFPKEKTITIWKPVKTVILK